MFRTARGAKAIIALRCCHLNGRFEDYWEQRRAHDLHFYVAHPRFRARAGKRRLPDILKVSFLACFSKFFRIRYF